MSGLTAFIQARFSSTRLPGKVLKKCENGKTLLEYVYEQVSCSQAVDRIVILTSVEDSDDNIVKLCEEKGFECFRGDLEDVANRFCQAIRFYSCDSFLRVCADRAYYDYRLIDKAYDKFSTSNADIVTNVFPSTYPKGQTVEIVKSSKFLEAYENMSSVEEKEHIFNYFYKNSVRYKIFNIETEIVEFKKYNMCIDDILDYNRFLYVTHMTNKPFNQYHWDEFLVMFDEFEKDCIKCAE